MFDSVHDRPFSMSENIWRPSLGRALIGNDHATLGCFNAGGDFDAFSEVFEGCWDLAFRERLSGLMGSVAVTGLSGSY
ncbi:MAG: hypothetical protein ABR607_10160 [Pyrinomonadaceae bacterium]